MTIHIERSAAALAAAILVFIAAASCGLALAVYLVSLPVPGGFPDRWEPLRGVGAFLFSSFSWASVLLPAYLAGAGLVLLKHRHSYADVALLALAAIPFLTLAFACRITFDESSFADISWIEALGRTEATIAVFLVAALELVLMAQLKFFIERRADERDDSAEGRILTGPRRTGLLEDSRRSAAVETRIGQDSSSGLARADDSSRDESGMPILPPVPDLRSVLRGSAEPVESAGSDDDEAYLEPLDGESEDELDEGDVPDEDDSADPIAPELPPAVEPQDPGSIPPNSGGEARTPGIETSGAESVPPHSDTDPRHAESVLPTSGLVSSTPAVEPRNPAVEPQPTDKPVRDGEKAATLETGEAGKAPGLEVSAFAKDGLPVPDYRTLPQAPIPPAGIIARLWKPSKKGYVVPVEGILNQYPDGQYWIIDEATRQAAVVLRETLAEFHINAEVTGIRKGPVITLFELLPAPGVKLSKIVNLSDNIALRLAASSVRIVAPIPGKHAVGIEVPNRHRAIVSFRELIENEGLNGKKMEIPVMLGKDIAGEAQAIDLIQTPHLLIAGSTGSGKSVCVNSIILSILYKRSPDDVKLILIDPKIVELKLYNDIPHLMTPVITEPKRAYQALQYCIYEMERRYSMLDKLGVRDIRSYNRRIKERNLMQEKIPYIVVIIDEFADLMALTGKELESTLARLAAMSRAVGIHLVLATQRPSIDVITGLIKANIPSRIAFMVASKMDSRIIIDAVGAEKLLGRGDMLFASAWDPFPVRLQGAYISEEEVEKAVEYVKTLGEPEYIDEEIFFDDEEEESEASLFDQDGDDPLMDKALEIVMQAGKASASYLQRRLKIGYNRAARLVELMEERGIVGPANGSKARDIMHMPDKPGYQERPGRVVDQIVPGGLNGFGGSEGTEEEDRPDAGSRPEKLD